MEISQISGIVPNVSMLIKVVMRIVVAVGEKERRKGRNCVTGPEKLPSGLDPLYRVQMFLNGEIQRFFHKEKMFPLPAKHPVPPLCRSSRYFWQTTKKGLL